VVYSRYISWCRSYLSQRIFIKLYNNPRGPRAKPGTSASDMYKLPLLPCIQLLIYRNRKSYLLIILGVCEPVTSVQCRILNAQHNITAGLCSEAAETTTHRHAETTEHRHAVTTEHRHVETTEHRHVENATTDMTNRTTVPNGGTNNHLWCCHLPIALVLSFLIGGVIS